MYEQSVFDKREAEFNLLGAGVTATAQATFDTLHKTLPCKWDRDIIVILGTVKLAPPYNSKSIRYVVLFLLKDANLRASMSLPSEAKI